MKKLKKKLYPDYMFKYFVGYNYMNLMDALITTLMLMYLPVTEMNPVMAKLISLDFMSFIVVKAGLGLLSTLFAIRNKSYNLIRFSFFLYLAVVTWNIGMLAIYSNFLR